MYAVRPIAAEKSPFTFGCFFFVHGTYLPLILVMKSVVGKCTLLKNTTGNSLRPLPDELHSLHSIIVNFCVGLLAGTVCIMTAFDLNP